MILVDAHEARVLGITNLESLGNSSACGGPGLIVTNKVCDESGGDTYGPQCSDTFGSTNERCLIGYGQAHLKRQ